VKIDREELAQRLAEADRRRLALRKATVELAAVGKLLFKRPNKLESDVTDRSERSSRRPARRISGS
jgi:hypothetical protein